MSKILKAFSTEWLTKLASVFDKTYFQEKVLSANATGTGTSVLSELNFNNLVVGKWYRLNLKCQSSGSANNRSISLYNGSTNIDVSIVNTSSSDENRIVKVFQATDTTVYYDVTANATGIFGNGESRYTYAQLE